MISDQTLTMEKKGLKGFGPICFFFFRILEKKLFFSRKKYFWNGTLIDFQYICYIITLARISTQKNEKLGDMKWWDACYLFTFLTCV